MNTSIELRNMDVTPLSELEEVELNGGLWWLIPALVAGLIVSAINDFGDIRKGFADGYNGTPLSEERKEVPCCVCK